MFITSVFCAILICCIDTSLQQQQLSFVVDYEHNTFLKDGQPFRYISGTLHYFQVPHELWRDRMERARALGVNVIQTYIDWNKHELFEGQYYFDQGSNITAYFELAQSLNLLVILRAGPYIDAEQDFGGFPYWLLKYPDIILRSSQDQRYLDAVDRWFSILLPKIRPLLYSNGGPIIMFQVENEYGSYGCDKNYTTWLNNTAQKYLQDQVVYFTTDGYYDYMISCGRVDGTLTTIDFGPMNQADVLSAFGTLRKYMPKGPLVNSEFYPGWIDEWGQPSKSTTPAEQVTDTMTQMYHLNASFNIYPVHGGTNWGYEAGSEDPPFRTITTEYDFDAPISEAGDSTSKFLDMRSTIEQLTGQTIQYQVPTNSTKYNYGKVLLQYVGNVFDLMYTLTTPGSMRQSVYPLTMEQLDLPYGFAMYQSKFTFGGSNLSIGGVHDRAYVMVDYEIVQVIQRDSTLKSSPGPIPRTIRAGSVLHILVENQGRVCYGSGIVDPKGLILNVTLDGQVITNWTMYPFNIENLFGSTSQVYRKKSFKTAQNPVQCNSRYLPSFYSATFIPPQLGDTFLNTTGWGKGQLFLNSVNIGRYWPVAGPQMSLYIPAVYLKSTSQIIAFELDQPGNCDNGQSNMCYMNFVDAPIYTSS